MQKKRKEKQCWQLFANTIYVVFYCTSSEIPVFYLRPLYPAPRLMFLWWVLECFVDVVDCQDFEYDFMSSWEIPSCLGKFREKTSLKNVESSSWPSNRDTWDQLRNWVLLQIFESFLNPVSIRAGWDISNCFLQLLGGVCSWLTSSWVFELMWCHIVAGAQALLKLPLPISLMTELLKCLTHARSMYSFRSSTMN